MYKVKNQILFVVLSVFIPIVLNANIASIFTQNYKSILAQSKYTLSACKVNGGEKCSKFFSTLISSPELYSYKLVYITDIDSNEVIKAEIIYKTGEEDLAFVSLAPWTTSSVLFNISYFTDSAVLINQLSNNVQKVIGDYISKVNQVMKDVVFDTPSSNPRAFSVTSGKQTNFVYQNDFIKWNEAKNIKTIKSQLKDLTDVKSGKVLNVAMKKKAMSALDKMSKQHWKGNPLSKMVYKITYNRSSAIPRKFQTPSKLLVNTGSNAKIMKYLTKASFFTNVGSWTSALVAAGLDISSGVKAGNDYIIARGSLNAALFAIDLSAFLASSLGFTAAASVLNPISLGATILSIPIMMSIHEMERNHKLLEAFTDFATSKSFENFANTIKETNGYSSIWAPLSIADSTHWYSEYITNENSRSHLKQYINQWQSENNTQRYPYQDVDELKSFIDGIRSKGAGAWYAVNRGKTYFPVSEFPSSEDKGIFYIGGKSCEAVVGTPYNDFIDTGTLNTEGCNTESDGIFGNAGDDIILLGEGNHGAFWQETDTNISGGSGNDTLILDGMSKGENGEKRAFYVNLLENNAGWKNVQTWCDAHVYYRLVDSYNGRKKAGTFSRRIAHSASENQRNDECVNNHFLPFVEINKETNRPYCPNENLCKITSTSGSREYHDGRYVTASILISGKGNESAYDYPTANYPFQEQIDEYIDDFTIGTIKHVENVIGTEGIDKLIGDDKANFINGKGGDDIIYTLGGDDQVDASNGSPYLKVFLGDGDDEININEGYVNPGDGEDIIKTVANGYNTKQIRISGSNGDDIYNLGKTRTVFGNILKRDGNTNPTPDNGKDTVSIEYELLGFPSFLNSWNSLRQNSEVLGFYWDNPYYACQGVLSQCYDLKNPSNYQSSFYLSRDNMEVLAISFVESMCTVPFPDDLGLDGSTNICVDDEKSHTITHLIEPNPNEQTSTTIFSSLGGKQLNLRNVDQGDVILGLRSDFNIEDSESFEISSSIYKKSLIFLPKSNTYRYNNENSELITDFSKVDFNITTGNFDDIVFTGLAKKNIVYTNSGNDKIIADDVNSSQLIVYSGEGDDYIIGSSNNDFIKSENGNDIIRANDGNDYILAGQGVNKVYGGLGNDIYDMNNAINTIIFDNFGSNYITCIDIPNLIFTEQTSSSKYSKLTDGVKTIYIYDLVNSDSQFHLKACESNEFTHVITKNGMSTNIDSNITMEYNEIVAEFTSYLNMDVSSPDNNPNVEVDRERVDTVINMRGFISPIERSSLFSSPSQEEINSPLAGRSVVLSDNSLNLENLKYITVESCCNGTMLPEKITVKIPEDFAQTSQVISNVMQSVSSLINIPNISNYTNQLWLKFYEDVDIRGVKVKIEIVDGLFGKKIKVTPIEARYYTGTLEDYDFNLPVNGIDFNPIQLIPTNRSDQRGYGIKNVELHFATGKFNLEDKFLDYNDFVRASGITINKTENIQTIANLKAIRARGHQENGTNYINENFYTMAPIPEDFSSGDELWFKYYVYGVSGSKYVKGIKVRIDEYDDRFELRPIKASYQVLNETLINEVKAQSIDGKFDAYSSLIDLETQPSYTLARSLTSSGYGMKEIRMVFINK